MHSTLNSLQYELLIFGMGRGPVIERQKQLNNAARGKSFSLHAKLVSMAASSGADPTENAALAEAIYKAKKDNVTNEVIDRAIKRGSGQEK